VESEGESDLPVRREPVQVNDVVRAVLPLATAAADPARAPDVAHGVLLAKRLVAAQGGRVEETPDAIVVRFG
jgi:type IV secretory pathway protease TraF